MWQQSWSLTSTCRKSSSYSKLLHKKREAFPPKSQSLTTSCELPASLGCKHSLQEVVPCVYLYFCFPLPAQAVLIVLFFFFFTFSVIFLFYYFLFSIHFHILFAIKTHIGIIFSSTAVKSLALRLIVCCRCRRWWSMWIAVGTALLPSLRKLHFERAGFWTFYFHFLSLHSLLV